MGEKLKTERKTVEKFVFADNCFGANANSHLRIKAQENRGEALFAKRFLSLSGDDSFD